MTTISEDQNNTDLPDGKIPGAADQHIRERALQRLAIDPDLYRLGEIDVLYDEGMRTLWSFMNPINRPSFNPNMLVDFKRWQAGIENSFGPGRVPLDFLVLGSRFPGVFCYGGDLHLFVELIRSRNCEALRNYGYQCVDILHRNMLSLDLPMVTIGLVQGDALGGGFEALLSFDTIIAERGTKFGLPEAMFGLFPGMGAHVFLARKLGAAQAERIILGGKNYLAEELYDMGLVHELAEPGDGENAVRNFIRRKGRHLAGLIGARKAMAAVEDISLQELRDVVDLWADSALQLREHDLKLMLRLVSAQSEKAQANKSRDCSPAQKLQKPSAVKCVDSDKDVAA